MQQGERINQLSFFNYEESEKKDSNGINWNHDGYLAEMEFDVECMKRGLIPYASQVGSVKADRIIVCGNSICRVQIKSCGRRTPNGSMSVNLINNNEKKFSSDGLDVIAVKAKDNGTWWIIPATVANDCTNLTLNRSCSAFINN